MSENRRPQGWFFWLTLYFNTSLWYTQ